MSLTGLCLKKIPPFDCEVTAIHIAEKKRKHKTSLYVIFSLKGWERRRLWSKCNNSEIIDMLLLDYDRAKIAQKTYTWQDVEKRVSLYQDLHVPPLNEKHEVSVGKIRTVGELVRKCISVLSANEWSIGYIPYRESLFDSYISRQIGSLLVENVTTMILQDYIDDLANQKASGGNKKQKSENVSIRTRHEVIKLLSQVFDMAVIDFKLIKENPVKSVKLPDLPAYEREWWDDITLRKACDLCEDIELRLYIELMVQCCRSGETCAFLWGDFFNLESEKPYVRINKTLRSVSINAMEKANRRGIIYVFPNITNNAKSTLVLKAPKTKASIRKIYIPPSLAKLLLAYKSIQAERIAKLGKVFKRYGNNDFLFVQDNGRPYTVNMFTKRFKNFIEKHKLPIVDAYSLRHTGATIKLSRTGDIKAVQGDLGHATPHMVLFIYAKIIDENRYKNAMVMEDVLYGKSKPQKVNGINTINSNVISEALLL